MFVCKKKKKKSFKLHFHPTCLECGWLKIAYIIYFSCHLYCFAYDFLTHTKILTYLIFNFANNLNIFLRNIKQIVETQQTIISFR